jgi:hypothetical protein
VSAIISPCGAYRYTLHRRIPSVLRWVKPCLFVMLNPSTADATMDDPTIRRCIGFAKREGCTDLTVVNLFALRATDPKQIQAATAMGKDPIGPDNWNHFTAQIEGHQRIGLIIAAWGAHPMASTMPVHHERLREARALCLGMTKDGSPRHPLYVKADQPLVTWAGDGGVGR